MKLRIRWVGAVMVAVIAALTIAACGGGNSSNVYKNKKSAAVSVTHSGTAVASAALGATRVHAS